MWHKFCSRPISGNRALLLTMLSTQHRSLPRDRLDLAAISWGLPLEQRGPDHA